MLEPNRHYPVLRNTLIFFASLPLLSLLQFLGSEAFPPNIFIYLMQTFGHSSLVLLVIALAITPLRRWLAFLCHIFKIKWGKRLADWNFLIQLRRPIGLCAFFYMLLHILVYLALELDFDWRELLYEIQHRDFLLSGVIAAVLTTLLASTSGSFWRRKLGRWWRRLHRCMYVLCPLAVLHYFLFSKPVEILPWAYMVLISILLIHRILVLSVKTFKRNDDTGMEVNRKIPQRNFSNK